MYMQAALNFCPQCHLTMHFHRVWCMVRPLVQFLIKCLQVQGGSGGGGSAKRRGNAHQSSAAAGDRAHRNQRGRHHIRPCPPRCGVLLPSQTAPLSLGVRRTVGSQALEGHQGLAPCLSTLFCLVSVVLPVA